MDDSFLSARDFASHPEYIYPSYGSSVKRGPTRPLIPLKERLRDQRVPVYGAEDLGALDNDLTRNAVRNGEPLGERIIVTGRVLDEGGRPVRNTLVEIWQANAAGHYVHKVDQHDAPLDPNFLGAGRCSLFGEHFGSRLVTQMYFPGDPLLAFDPIFQGTPEHARDRLIANFSLDTTQEAYALGYDFDIVLRGRNETPMER
ncbi:MAG: Protocatechuate 3,4-dioxygenase beta chain (EC [uncultured Paraburkholderia sp.]|nr:MAG: Protocatechuate 3,4-dioxygenase beta chain (EC [uncultured Paraburkholderia sp.]